MKEEITDKFEKVIEDIVDLCYSDILKHSLQYFQKGDLTKEERLILGLNIINKSQTKAKKELTKFLTR